MSTNLTASPSGRRALRNASSGIAGVGIAQRDPDDDQELRGDAEFVAEHVRIDDEVDGDGRVDAVILRRQRDALADRPQVEDGPRPEYPVHAEVHGTGCAEERAVGHEEVVMEGGVFRAGAPGLGASSCELLGALTALGSPGAREGYVWVRGDLCQGPLQGYAPYPLEHLAPCDEDLPGLGVGPGRGAKGVAEDRLEGLSGHRAVQEGADSPPGPERVADIHASSRRAARGRAAGRAAAGRRRDDRSVDLGRLPQLLLDEAQSGRSHDRVVVLLGEIGGHADLDGDGLQQMRLFAPLPFDAHSRTRRVEASLLEEVRHLETGARGQRAKQQIEGTVGAGVASAVGRRADFHGQILAAGLDPSGAREGHFYLHRVFLSWTSPAEQG